MKASLLRILCIAIALTATARGAAAQAPPSGQSSRPGNVPPGPRRTPAEGRREPRSNPNASHPGGPGAQKADAPPRNALQFGPIGRWWDDTSVVSSVGLSRQQQKQMDSIFDAHRSTIVNSYKAFLKAQSNLDAVNKGAHPDQQKVFTAIDEVNQARADLQKAASGMLLEIRQKLTPEQIEKLEKLQ